MRIMFSLPTHICISLSILCHILYQFQSVLNPPTRHPLLQATHFRTCNIIEFEEAKKKKNHLGTATKNTSVCYLECHLMLKSIGHGC